MKSNAIGVASLVVGLLVAAGPLAWAQEDDASAPAPADVESTAEPTGEVTGEVTGEPSGELATPPTETVSQEPAGVVSIDFKDADIRQVLRVISLKSGVDIVAGSDVEGLVTIKLTNVPWEQALDIILRTYGFTYERKGNIVRVMTLDALEQEALSTEVFLLNYAKAEDVPDVVQEMLSDRGRIKFDGRTNTVIVTDVPSTLFQIAEVIKRLDQRTPQVLIESRIVETKLEKDESLGIDWSDSYTLTQTQTSFPSSFPFKNDTTFGSILDDFVSGPRRAVDGPTSLLTANPTTTLGSIGIGTLSNSALAMTLNALKQRTDTKIVSNPTLTVLNNQEAKIHIGDEYPLPNFSVDPSTGRTTVSGFDTKTIGTVLTVTPHVNQSQEIVVDLKPEVITPLANVTFDVGGGNSVSLPRFSTQTVTTQVRVLDGNTIAIGGLVKESRVDRETKVPLLGDIPILGALFTTKRQFDGSSGPSLQQDLLIFLTVKLEVDPSAKRTVASTLLE